MVGVTPSQIAMLFLKINVLLFVITLGANSLAIFPYYMHITQIANNVAMDVANKNYVMKSEVNKFVEHLNKSEGEAGANTYSILTFKNADMTGGTIVSGSVSNDDLSNYARSGGLTAFTTPINPDPNSFLLTKGGETTVAVSANVLSGPKSGKSLLVEFSGGSFDPLNNVDHLVKGMNGTNMGNNSTLVNRGTPFKVTVKSRYELRGGAFGFMFSSALPINAEAIGVTTQYYQYDSP